MNLVQALGDKVLAGEKLTRQEAESLYPQPLESLCQKADEIRRHFCGDGFDLCSIVNAKSGRCSENCRFCAQSAWNATQSAVYPLKDTAELVDEAKRQEDQGMLRYSIVTAGKRVTPQELDQICRAAETILEETTLAVCVSAGLLEEREYRQLKQAGVSRVHNNLETSQRHFPHICTTHTFQDKCDAIRGAQAAGLAVCSGGILGMGETPADRIDLAMTLGELGVVSVPVNLLNAIPGTPLAQLPRLGEEELRRTVAVWRFLLPRVTIRLAGGRGLLADKGRGCFRAGANGAISGDMLTTAGVSGRTDRQMMAELGYEVRRDHG